MTWGLLEGEMYSALRGFAGFGPVYWEQEFIASPCLSVRSSNLGLPFGSSQCSPNWNHLCFTLKMGSRLAGASLQEQGAESPPRITVHAQQFSCRDVELPSLAVVASQTPLEDPGEAGALLVLHAIDASYRIISVCRNSLSVLRHDCSERCHENRGQGERRLGNRNFASVLAF